MVMYRGSDVVVEYDGTAGGALAAITQHVETISNPAVESAMEDSHTFGDSWREQLPAGLKSIPDITLAGKFDDTASTTPNAMMGYANVGHATTRTLKITFGGSNTFQVETYLKRWTLGPKRGGITTYEAVLTATGAIS